MMLKLFRQRLIVTICTVILLLLTFSILSFQVDKKRVNDCKKPLFTFHTDSINDGGTNVYYGLGYQIIVWNTISYDGNEILSGIEVHNIIGMINPLTEGPTIRLNATGEVKK